MSTVAGHTVLLFIYSSIGRARVTRLYRLTVQSNGARPQIMLAYHIEFWLMLVAVCYKHIIVKLIFRVVIVCSGPKVNLDGSVVLPPPQPPKPLLAVNVVA